MSHFITLIPVPKPDEGDCFEMCAESYIDGLMEPFYEATEDPNYLVFNDKTEEAQGEYKNGKVDCVKLPDGAVVLSHSPRARGFTIKDGQVYQERFGQLKSMKRSKKAKKMQALPDYPLNKLYSTYEKYAEDYCCYNYNDEHKAYGYFSNPNAFWDWYQIGGRWPFMFMVKEDCQNIVTGERSWATEKDNQTGPAGYKWVAGAKKSDIEWEKMKDIALESAKKRFAELELKFIEGSSKDEDPFFKITEEGIISWNTTLYKKGETLEQYLDRQSLGPKFKYPIYTYGFVEEGEYQSHGKMGWWAISMDEKSDDEWRKQVEEFIERIPEDDFIVSVDCHI